MAGTTGLEPATSAVTGQRSNQLNYVPFLPGLSGIAPDRPETSAERMNCTPKTAELSPFRVWIVAKKDPVGDDLRLPDRAGASRLLQAAALKAATRGYGEPAAVFC